jgi:16S rRNA (cytosine1402-N4)-methyltransferase
LEQLNTFLDNTLGLLRPGGRLCIVAFHSLEDRMVKVKMREWARSCRCPEEVAKCSFEGEPFVRLLTRKALKPEAPEVQRNPRARSARLRAVEKL